MTLSVIYFYIRSKLTSDFSFHNMDMYVYIFLILKNPHLLYRLASSHRFVHPAKKDIFSLTLVWGAGSGIIPTYNYIAKSILK